MTRSCTSNTVYVQFQPKPIVQLSAGCNPSKKLVYYSDGSEPTATLRQKMQIKVAISPSDSVLAQCQPVPELTLKTSYTRPGSHQTTGFVVSGKTRPEKNGVCVCVCARARARVHVVCVCVCVRACVCERERVSE